MLATLQILSVTIFKRNVNVEQTSKSSSLTTSHEQSLVVKTRHETTRKGYHNEVSSSEDSGDSEDNNRPNHKSPRVNSHHGCVLSLAAPAHCSDE